jgi:hypothetical protein
MTHIDSSENKGRKKLFRVKNVVCASVTVAGRLKDVVEERLVVEWDKTAEARCTRTRFAPSNSSLAELPSLPI